MDLIFDLLILAFFGRGELLVYHSELCRLLSGSYSKIHDSSCYDMCEKLFVIFDAFKKVKARIPSVFLLFVGEVFWNQLGTNFLHAQFLGKNFVDGSVIQILLTTDHSDLTTARAFVTCSSIFEVQALPERGSSSTLS